MRRRNTVGESNWIINGNQGFSLVEVLVCIAIIAIACVPIFSGLNLSVKLNNNAHYTQKVTAFAQEELEKIKVMSVSEYKQYVLDNGGEIKAVTSGKTSDDAIARRDDFQNNGGEGVSSDLLDDLFNPINCCREVEIGGKKYILNAIFSPSDYSQINTGGKASNVNVSPLSAIAEADGSRFPVVTNEINMYDEQQDAGGAAIINNILSRYKTLHPDTTVTRETVFANMKKTADVNLSKGSGGDSIKIECVVSYQYEEIELTYKVYSATYAYDPVSDDESLGVTAGEYSGGNIYIAARPFQDSSLISEHSTNHCYNIVNIKWTGDELPVNIYFVRGKTDVSDYNFDEINVFSNEKTLNYLTPASLAGNGYKECGEIKFYTNVKRHGWESVTPEEETTIGQGEYEVRCYGITIEMIEKDTGDIAARFESSKIER